MNRNNRNSFSKPNNNTKRGNALMNASIAKSGHGPNISSPTPELFKPLQSHSNKAIGQPLLDDASNPFSHLALEVEMDRPSANPFDNGVMPSFDDFAIDTAYQYEDFKNSVRNNPDDKRRRTRRPPRKDVMPLTSLLDVPTPKPSQAPKPTQPLKPIQPPKPIQTPKEVFRDAIHVTVPNIPDIQDELNLDDFFLPKPVTKPSADLKPQINIRSRQITVTDARSQNNISNREPVVKPSVRIEPPTRTVPPVRTEPPARSEPFIRAEPPVRTERPATQTKQVIDYFGTQSSSKPQKEPEFNQKDEYYEETLEANKILFGAEHPSRPLTNMEISKRKKLTLKLVDQKLKAKLSEMMNRMSQPLSTSSADAKDTFEDQMQNFVPDSIPDNQNSEPSQNWVPHPSQQQEQPTWNNYSIDVPNKDNWPIRPSAAMFQSNPGWNGAPHMNPYPPGIDPMHNMNFPGMPPVRPPWHNNSNQWQPPQHWQPEPNWNMRPFNPQHAQSNMSLAYPLGDQYPKPVPNPLPVPPVNRSSDVTKAEAELELREKEFIERTLSGVKRKSPLHITDLQHRRTPEKLSRRSRDTSRHLREKSRHSREKSRHSREKSRHSRDRSRRSREKSRNSRDRSRRSQEKLGRRRSRNRSQERLRETERLHRTPSNRSVDRTLHHGIISPSLSPLREWPLGVRDRSQSFEHREQWMFSDEFSDGKDQFEQSIFEQMANYRSPSREFRRSNSRSEDLRVRLSQRRIKEQKEQRKGSPSDLRNKLLSDRSESRNRPDDLRNHLSERSRDSRKRSISHSNSRSSKRSTKTKADDESEWIRFNDIVGMLMNLSTEKNGELTTEQLTEKKEVMRLLLENPDLLELDDKFVRKFGINRLNVAVKEAENILYPNGVPDERIASLISQKISTMSTDAIKSSKKPKEIVPIEWIKLCKIVDVMLGLPVGDRKNLSSTDKRMIERDEILLKISDDPKTLLNLGTKYGHRNVETTVNYANKILFRNGVRDRKVDKIIEKEREVILKRTGKVPTKSNADAAKTNSMEWNQLHQLVTQLYRSHLGKNDKMIPDDYRRRDELLVQMSRDPDAVRSDTKFMDKIDKAVLDDIIDKCKKAITCVRTHEDKLMVHEFECQRTKLITHLKSKAPTTTIHEQIRLKISPIYGKGAEKWTGEEKKEREKLIEALIKDPESLKENKMFMDHIKEPMSVDDIISDIKQILSQLDVSKARRPRKFHISSSKVIDIPFVVKIEDESGQLNDKTKTVLLKALREMISEIENPPKPKLLQQRYIDKRVEVVCANLLTFEWLKRAIVSDFKDKWSGAQLKVERVPIATKIPRDKLKPVVVVFKDTRATLPFDSIMDDIKKENFKLNPERWELLDARGKDGDYKKKTIGIDIESLASLEQMNRFAHFGRALIYFDISYMGDDNVPNFEATCQ